MANSQKDHLTVLRAADEMRRGTPVIVSGKGRSLLVLALEKLDPQTVAAFAPSEQDSAVLVSPHRADTLHIGRQSDAGALLAYDPAIALERYHAIADPSLDLAAPLKGPLRSLGGSVDQVHEAALKLAKIARLLPALLVKEIASLSDGGGERMAVKADAVAQYDLSEAYLLEEVARAPVPLADATECQLIAFRPTSGGSEHLAVMIRDPAPHDPVLVRLHSECFTGDLLASMKCDCGEQLRGAIRAIDTAGGGLVLYMAQEGRGIGLVSKLKAYALQAEGFDTVDANTRLGFGVDERVFASAAQILKKLGYKKVRLMTNNPAKIKALTHYGIEVVERVKHAFAPNPHNEQYLNVKRARTGHLLGEDDL